MSACSLLLKTPLISMFPCKQNMKKILQEVHIDTYFRNHHEKETFHIPNDIFLLLLFCSTSYIQAHVHKTASPAEDGNSVYYQSSDAYNIKHLENYGN